MSKNCLVIVESPTKAKTIKKFLPKNFVVEASMGHVRDLPQSASDIPKDLKKEEWAKIGVNVEKDFEPLYVIPKGKFKIISELRKKLKKADELYLATDEDREGESISWHLLQLLKPKVPVKRMVFHEITKSAIQRALQESRDVDMRLVRAQETRRILDRLVGYTLSPLIWKKIAYGLSAGRVQSTGLRLIVDRERQRLKFQKATYWDISALLKKDSESFQSKLISVDGKRVATGKDFDETTGKLSAGKEVKVLEEKEATSLASRLKGQPWTIDSKDEREVTSRPSIPFITSTLQQEANRKLGFSARETMRAAQKLYEEGLITYMRTDSPNLSQEGINGARTNVEKLYGKEFLSPQPRQFSSKSKGAQEAHEAIRPAGFEFVHPKDVHLGGKEAALYELIWKRTLACQMADAKKLSMTVKVKVDNCIFTASGTRIVFPGFLKVYVEGSDDPEKDLENKEVILPAFEVGDTVSPEKVDPLSHETKPPARFTEASIVQKLEKEGIGRPSTYASIISTIQERGYVRKVGNQLVPTFTGFVVIQLLEKNFDQFVDLGFTSKMEEALDEIAEGSLDWLPYLKKFYLGSDGLLEQVKTKEKKINANESREVKLDHLDDIQVRVGRYGAYIVHVGKTEEVHASIPEDCAPADLSAEKADELIELQKRGPTPLGVHPETGQNIYCLTGRYGPYVQLGEVTEEVPKPKRGSLMKGMDPKTLTLEEALKVLSLPRHLGDHPETGKPINANMGRFGPYVVHDGDFRSLKKDDNLFEVDLKRALEILAEEKRGRGGSKMVKDLGKHSEDDKAIAVYEGKYGKFLKYGSKNIGLPKDVVLDAFGLKEAQDLIAEKAPKKKGSAKSKAKKKG